MSRVETCNVSGVKLIYMADIYIYIYAMAQWYLAVTSRE